MPQMTIQEIEAEREQEAIERAFRRAMIEYFAGLDTALSYVRRIPEPERIAAEILARTPRLTGTLDRGIERAMRQGVFRMVEQFGEDAILNPRNHAVRRSIEAATEINETTTKQLLRWRQRAATRPDSWAKRTLRELFDIYSTSRADLIARHEARLGYETGRQLSAYSMLAAEKILQKHWYNQGDDRVTDECIANQRAGWITYGGTFPSGAMHPPQHYNCRCWLRYRELQPGEQVPTARRAVAAVGGPTLRG